MFFPEDLSFEDNSLTLAEPEDAHDHDHDHDEEESAVAEGDKPDELPPPLVGECFDTSFLQKFYERKLEFF